MTLRQKIQDIQQWDALRAAGRSRGLVGRTLGRAVGSALIARAASGRDGVVGKLARVAGAAGGVRAAARRGN
jgi:hypothetical protein